MIDKKIANLILDRLNEKSLVLDIGGGRYPWFRANYVIDKRKYEEKVGKIAFVGNDKIDCKKEYFNENTWIDHDFYNLPWPFEDNFFDFSLCMHTLEDLRDPLPICKEIQRVSKSGYISFPTRSIESSMGVSNNSKIYGYAHHRWFVEIENGGLVFKIKTPLLFQKLKYLIKNPGQKNLNFFWDKKFNFKEEYLLNNFETENDLKIFYNKHKKWLKDFKKSDFKNKLYNYWPENWGKEPDFKQMAEFDFHSNKIIYFYRKIKNKIKNYEKKY